MKLNQAIRQAIKDSGERRSLYYVVFHDGEYHACDEDALYLIFDQSQVIGSADNGKWERT